MQRVDLDLGISLCGSVAIVALMSGPPIAELPSCGQGTTV